MRTPLRLLVLATIIAEVLWLTGVTDAAGLASMPEFIRQWSAADSAAGDEFGWSLALDGPHAIVGSPGHDGTSVDNGAAYLYDVLRDVPLGTLVPTDGASGTLFGTSVAIQGNLAVVGAMLDSQYGRDVGAAYVFDVTTGQQLYKLVPNDPTVGAEFGVSVALDGGVILVGAHKDGAGSAYLFDAASGHQLGKLRANDAAPDDLFGVAVALDGGTALIGARYDDDGAIAAGAAYLFDVASQTQLHKLTAHDPDRGDRYGMHLDLEGNWAVIGSRYDDDAIKSSGSAYVYDVTTGQQIHKLVPSDTTPSDQFGSAIAIDGDLAVIGALDDDHNGPYAGSAYLFNVRTGEELYKFNAVDTMPFDRMGVSVAFDDGTILIGAPMVDYAGAPNVPTGKVYYYSVPEPSTILLSLFGFVTLFVQRRSRR